MCPVSAAVLLCSVSSSWGLKLGEHISHLFGFWKKTLIFAGPCGPGELTLPWLVSAVPDDPADAVRAPPGAQAAAVHLRLQGQVPAAAGPAHPGLARAGHQKAAGGAGHLPEGQRGDSQLRLCPAV